jgi:hypothetical protein
LSQDDVNVYKSMPPIPDIDCPIHTLSSAHQPPKISCPSHDPVSEEEDEGTDDGRTLVEVIRSNKAKTSKEGASSLGDDLLPSHSSKQRVTARKHKTSASPGGDEDKTPK